jgi:hypothetical protein
VVRPILGRRCTRVSRSKSWGMLKMTQQPSGVQYIGRNWETRDGLISTDSFSCTGVSATSFDWSRSLLSFWARCTWSCRSF